MPHQPLFNEVKRVLMQLLETVQGLSFDDYTAKIPTLGNATIGEHNRHIIELFLQLNYGYENEVINYDERKRDYRLQQNIDFAAESIATIIAEVDKPDRPLTLISLYNNQEVGIHSNYLREVLYNLEHCIHHQALIRVGLGYLNVHVGDESFGVAKSTMEFRNNVHGKFLQEQG